MYLEDMMQLQGIENGLALCGCESYTETLKGIIQLGVRVVYNLRKELLISPSGVVQVRDPYNFQVQPG